MGLAKGPGGLAQGLVESMAKWKRKKHDVPEEPKAEEHFSPLGLALLEQFAHGMSVPGLCLFFPWCSDRNLQLPTLPHFC